MPAAILFLAVTLAHRLYRLDGRIVVAAYRRTGGTPYRRTHDGAILSAHILPDSRARTTAQSPTQYCACVDGIRRHTGGQQQDDCQRFFHDLSKGYLRFAAPLSQRGDSLVPNVMPEQALHSLSFMEIA
jgi:hypothetical protein